jgi:sodium transport system permease protein
MKKIIATFKKELRRILTDKRMLMSLVLPGVSIYILYSLIGSFTTMQQAIDEDYVYKIAVIEKSIEIESMWKTLPYNLEITEIEEVELETYKQKISDGTWDIIVIFDKDFYEEINNYDINSGLTAPEIKIYYNQTSNESFMIYQTLVLQLQVFEESISNLFDVNRETNITYNLASKEDQSIEFITGLVPFVLMLFLFTGAQTLASESIAGEKERGTIATMLATPVKRFEIALGKIFGLSVTVLISATSSFLGLMLSLPNLVGSESFTLSMYGPLTYFLLFIIILSTVLIFIVLISIISAYAKSIKEATSLIGPLQMVILGIGLTSILGVSSNNVLLYAIPIYNSVLSITDVFSIELQTISLVITVFSNFSVFVFGAFVLAKMFSNEKVMFNF